METQALNRVLGLMVIGGCYEADDLCAGTLHLGKAGGMEGTKKVRMIPSTDYRVTRRKRKDLR